MVGVNEYWEHDVKLREQNGTKREFARVARLTEDGKPILIFMGETTASGKIYPCSKPVVAHIAAGDRVQLIDGVIIACW